LFIVANDQLAAPDNTNECCDLEGMDRLLTGERAAVLDVAEPQLYRISVDRSISEVRGADLGRQLSHAGRPVTLNALLTS
jgi:hypothetical protein